MSAQETESPPEVLVCAVCSAELRPAEPVGNAGGKPAHLECWLRSRGKPYLDDNGSRDAGHHPRC